MISGSEPTYFDGFKMSGKQKIFMILMIAGTFMEQMDLYNFAVLAPAIIKTWGLSLKQIGYMHGSFAVGAVFGCLAFGWLADHKGRKYAMGLACIIGGIGSLLSSLAPGFNFLIMARIIAGLGITGALTCEASFLVEMVPSDKRQRYQGVLGLIALTGIPLSSIIAGKLLAINPENWRYVAGIPSIGILIGILFYLLVTESPRWLVSQDRVEEGKKAFKHITGRDLDIDPDFVCIVDNPSYREAFRIMFDKKYLKRTTLFLLIYLVLYNAGFMFMQWLPTLLSNEGMSIAQAAGFQKMVALAMVVGSLYTIIFGDMGGRKIPYAIAMGIVAISLLIVAGAGTANIQLLTIGLILVGLFYLSNQGFSSIYVSESYPTKVRVIIVSLFAVVQRGTNIFTNGVVAPKLYAAAGFSGYMATLASVYVIFFVLILWLGHRSAGKSLEELNSL